MPKVGDKLSEDAVIDFSVDIGDLHVDFILDGFRHDVYTNGILRHPSCVKDDVVNVLRWYYRCQQETRKLEGR